MYNVVKQSQYGIEEVIYLHISIELIGMHDLHIYQWAHLG